MNPRACLAIFRIRLAEGVQYRLAALSGATTSIFWALIEIVVFTVFYTYSQNPQAGIHAGLTLEQVVSYVWLGQIMVPICLGSIDNEIMQKITSGDVGLELCRPLDLYAHWFAKVAAGRVIPLFWRGSSIFLAGCLMPQAYRLSPPASGLDLFWVLLSVVSAIVLATSFGLLACAVRLSVPWGDGPMYILGLIGGVLSGGYLPLQLWPQAMQGFLLWQPFAGYLDIPLRIYLGSIRDQTALTLIARQWIWILALVLIGRALMGQRLKSIVIQGG